MSRHPDDALLGDDDLRADVAEHLQGCSRCRVQRRVLLHAMAMPELPPSEECTEEALRSVADALVRDSVVARSTYVALDAESGRYRAIRALGASARGSAAVAFDMERSRRVTVRRVPLDDDLRERLRGPLTAVRHPNLPRIYDVAHDHFTREHVDGRDFDAYLADAPRRGQLLDVLAQACSALAALHAAGLRHGAIHGRNLCVDGHGRAVLLDAGLGAGDSAEDWQALGQLFAPHLDRGSHPAPTELSASRFETLGLLGVGGMGEVHRVRDPVLDRVVALKTLKDEQAGRSTAAARFVHEARITAQLQHPGIVPVHEMVELDDGSAYFTMKQVVGRTLAEVLAEPPALRRGIEIFHRVCEAIAYAHAQDVVHMDLKPGNIMVGEFGEVLVLDWGLARRLGETTAWDERVAGTEGYMPEEQSQGVVGVIGPHTDVYALGIVLREILTAAGSSPELSAVANKAASLNWDERYINATDLAADIEAWRGQREVTAYRYGPLERFQRAIRPHAAPITVAAVMGLAVVVAVAVALVNGTQAQAERAQVLVEKAQLSMLAGDRVRAELYAAGALQRADRPEARGLLARVGHAWHPTLLERKPATDRLPQPPGVEGCAIARCSRDGRLLAAPDGTAITLWGIEDGSARREVQRLTGHSAQVLQIAWSPDRELLASVGVDGEAKLWDMQGDARVLATLPGHDDPSDLAFSADGTQLHIVANGEQRTWSVSERHGVGEVHTRIGVRDLDWTREGRIATVDAHGWVREWDPATGERVGGVFRVRGEKVTALSQHPETGMMALGLTDGSLLVLDDALRSTIADTHVGTASVESVSWRPGTESVAVADADGAVHLWTHGGSSSALVAGSGVAIDDLQWSADGSSLLLLDETGLARVLDADGAERWRSDDATAVAIGSSGQTVALARRSGDVLTVRLPSGRTTPLGRGERILGLALSGDGGLLATAGRDHSVRVWDLDSGEERVRLSAHLQAATALAFGPDDSVLATADAAGEILLWDLGPVRAPSQSLLPASSARYGATLHEDGIAFGRGKP